VKIVNNRNRIVDPPLNVVDVICLVEVVITGLVEVELLVESDVHSTVHGVP